MCTPNSPHPLPLYLGMYATKFGVTKEKMMGRLWGGMYINMKNGKWKHHWAAKMTREYR